MNNLMTTASLELLIDFKNGKIAPKVSGTIPIYGGNGILGYSNESNYENIVIIGRVGAYCGSVHIEKGKCWVSDNAIAGVPKDVENNEYNYYLLKSISLNKKQIGSSQPLLKQGILNSIDLKIHHDGSIRKSIGTLLSSLDSKIELNNRINAELEAMAKTLYDYWFVQFDFPDPSTDSGRAGKPYKTSGGKMVWNDELKREIPEGWEVKELADVAPSIMRGISPSYIENGGICVLNQKCIRDKTINFELSRRHNNTAKNASLKLIQYGDVLVNSTGFGTLGRVAIVKRLQEQITTVDSHITIVRCDSTYMKKLYLGYSMLIRQSEIEGLAEGSTGQTELSRINLGKLKMVIPPIDLQVSFENFINPQFQKMANNEAENQQLFTLRDWLLPMLMNGQVTVESSAENKASYEIEEEMRMAAEPGGN